MNDLEQLREAVRAFHNAGIEFVLIGGLAMVAHGASVVTQDIDLAYALDAENVERLAAFLPTIHARILGRPVHENFVITPALLQKVRFLNLKTDIGEVDVMREIPGVESFDALLQRSVLSDFGGFTVHVASIEDLIAMKRAANRLKDQMHLYELLALKILVKEHNES